jgi:hypothetical protein
MRPTGSAKLSISLVDEAPWTRIVLAGPLDENAKAVLARLADQTAATAVTASKVLLDLAGLTHANSVGIRDWSLFLRAFKDKREVELDRCTDDLVRTMNMVTGFHHRLPVRSLYREYGCSHCGHEQTELLVAGKDYKQGEIPRLEAKICAACGLTTDPFTPDDEFFQFLLTA